VATTASTETSATSEIPRESPMHASSNIALRPMIKFTVWFVVALVVIHLLIWWVFTSFRSTVGQEREVTGVSNPHIPPPPPQVQPSVEHNRLPAEDLAHLRGEEEAELKRRGLLDANGSPMFTDNPEELIGRINSWSK
jgi:hypothetical protein